MNYNLVLLVPPNKLELLLTPNKIRYIKLLYDPDDLENIDQDHRNCIIYNGPPSDVTACASLVKIWSLIQKIECRQSFSLNMTLVTLKIRSGPPTDVSVPVWSKSGHWFRRLEFGQNFFQSYMTLVTLKNRTMSHKSIISLVTPTDVCICASFVQICLLVQKMGADKAFSYTCS